MNRRLDGVNPLAYMGVKPSTPTQMVVNKDRRPTSNDLQNFQLGTWWIIPTRSSTPTNEVWILINKTASAATWIELDSGGGSVVPGSAYTLLTSDGSGSYGSNVGPGTAGQVLLSGGASANPNFVTPTAGSGLTLTSNATTLEYDLNVPITVDNGGTGLTSATIHNLLIGNNTAALTLLPPSSTSGVPLISQGAGADPAYGTAVVSGGGTGITAAGAAYAPICAGTTTTGAFQTASTGISTSGYVLTSTGASSLPTWQAAAGVVVVSVQVITSSGTYTPSSGSVRYVIVEIVGGGGGAGSARTTGVAAALSPGGGAGGYCKSLFDIATATGESITIGAAGTGGSGNSNGTDGGNTTFGSGGILMTAYGGAGSDYVSYNSGSNNLSTGGGAGGNATGGNIINVKGEPGDASTYGVTQTVPIYYFQKGANGGSSPFGRGGQASQYGGRLTSSYTVDATGYGSGGGSGIAREAGSIQTATGGSGTQGVCIITEFS